MFHDTNKPIISSFQLKVFFATFLAVFLMVTLQHMGISVRSLISPLASEKPEEKKDVFASILPKLEKIPNTYNLKKQTSLIAPASAVISVDEAHAYAVIDYDSGEVLAEKNLAERKSIASLTKIMTAIVALDLASPSELFTVTERAARQIPTKIGVVAGEHMTLIELLHAAMLTSANDAAEVIKDGIDQKYGQDVFVRAMNTKAKHLGLSNTQFDNPQGFDGYGNYSSTEDLAILTHYALTHYPLFVEVVAKDYHFLPKNLQHKQFDLYNWNGLIGVYPNVSGVKIGSTGRAKKTTIVLAEREGKKILVVLLGAPGILERDLWAAELLDLGFEKSMQLPPVAVTEEALRAKYNSWEYWN